jgi:hypothetical protein
MIGKGWVMRLSMFRLIPVLVVLPLFASIAPANGAPVTTMWQVVQTPSWDLMVRSVERVSDPVIGPDGATTRPAGRFAVFVIDLTNRSGRPLTPNPEDFALTVADGSSPVDLTTSSMAGTLAAERGVTALGAPIPPGQSARTLLLFDIEADAGLGTLTLHFRPAANRPIRIDECHCNLPSPSKMADAVGG